jgi:magnesium-transporting ATPase (P-type)
MTMKTATEQPKATGSKPGSKPDLKDDLKSLPMPEVEKELGSSPEGLTQVEAQKRLTQYGPNEIEEETTNPHLKFLSYFWGPIPWMIEVAVILSGGATSFLNPAQRQSPAFFSEIFRIDATPPSAVTVRDEISTHCQ